MEVKEFFDIVVVGAGHAGIEAAFAASKLGCKVLLTTLSLDSIGFMACNPNIGGTAKGNLVKEIDALGGVMGRIADKATIQVRMLNQGSGAAVHSLRAQADKSKYHRLMKQEIEKSDIRLLETEIISLVYRDGALKGVVTAFGAVYGCKAVVLATGVSLKSKIIIGEYFKETGPAGFQRAVMLSSDLAQRGIKIRRFKTGTPMRVKRGSVDFSKMIPQPGECGLPTFSAMTDFAVNNSHLCYLTYTNENTHKIILDNLSRAPLYNGAIQGRGPRYCPSIEDKVVRFADKSRHQIFVEPEGADTDEMYIQGLSTSMPHDIQEKMLHSVEGLENAEIIRYGYAIEYDCIDPTELLPTLKVKKLDGLYTAGQINGSSGYEEAAAQGLIAGINAAREVQGKEPFILYRDEAYIGVLIDDLVTKGTDEPYRMMTSRAEYRLLLRQDNADMRLTEKGYELGLVGEEQWQRFLRKKEKTEEIKELLKTRYSPAKVKEVFEKRSEKVPASGISGYEILRRNNLFIEDLTEIDDTYNKYENLILKQVESEIKYEGYLAKQTQAVKEMRRLEDKKIPDDIDYEQVESLRIEAKQRLSKVRPLTLAQAGRISGVNPADIVVLMVHLAKRGKL